MKMNLSCLLLLLISPPISASKVAYRLGHAKINGDKESPLRKRVMQDANCGQVKEGYTPTDVQSINSDMVGQKVMVTSTVTPSQIGMCTQMVCEDDPCNCNGCMYGLLFGELELVANDGADPLGCPGDECTWKETCTYVEGELVTIYAEVALNGDLYLAVDEHCPVGSITTQKDVPVELLPDTVCGTPFNDYIPVHASSINSDMFGEKVMVTWTIKNGDDAACTQLACPSEDQCCNTCSSTSFFDEIPLISQSDESRIGCSGTNCDWQDKCVYEDDEIVTVYGEVVSSGAGPGILPEKHCKTAPTCTDFADITFGVCYMHMGYGIVEGTCQPIGGCGTSEYVFFAEMEDCKENCVEIPTVATTAQTAFETICGAEREGYTKMSISSIGPDMDGQKVIVTSPINNTDVAACTVMACSEDDQCCNSCSSLPNFGEISLVPNGSENTVGCAGTNCDWQDNCVYENGDVVTVYGEVASDGTVLMVDDNCIAAATCEDLSGKSSGNCEMVFGFGVVDGTCDNVGVCDGEGYVFFDSIEACTEQCFSNEDGDTAAKTEASNSAEKHGSFQIMKFSQMLFVFAFLFY